MDKTYKRKDLSENSIELEITIPADAFSKSYDAVLQDESKNADVNGFRKGAIPKELVEPKLKDVVLIKTFEKVAPLYISQAITTEQLDMVAPPAYKTLPQMELGKDLVFIIVVTVMPAFKLGDLKKISLSKKDAAVTDKEVDDLIKQMESNPEVKADKGSDKWAAEVGAKLLFKGVATMDDLRKEILRVLTAQKESVLRREMETEALNQGIKLSKINVPEPAVDYEAHEREHTFEHELEHRQMTVDQFLKQNNITIEKMREMWKKDAREAIEADEFLNLFAKERGISVTPEELEEEVKKVAMANPNVDQATYQNPEWRNYINRVALKQKAFEAFMNEIMPAQK
jgi:FKBP-type peptidyl-prolyl cis-trans isomerase (trigger factor)